MLFSRESVISICFYYGMTTSFNVCCPSIALKVNSHESPPVSRTYTKFSLAWSPGSFSHKQISLRMSSNYTEKHLTRSFVFKYISFSTNGTILVNYMVSIDMALNENSLRTHTMLVRLMRSFDAFPRRGSVLNVNTFNTHHTNRTALKGNTNRWQSLLLCHCVSFLVDFPPFHVDFSTVLMMVSTLKHSISRQFFLFSYLS